MIVWPAVQDCYGGATIEDVTVEQIESTEERLFGLDTDACEALMSKAANPTVFMEPWFVSAWHSVFGDGTRPMVLGFRVEGELVGVAGLVKQEDRLVLIGDPDLFDYQDLVLMEDQESHIAEALLNFLLTNKACADDWTRLELPSVPAGSPTLEAMTATASNRGYKVDTTEASVSPVAELPNTWEEFLSRLSKKNRHELRRKIRRLEAAGEVKQITVRDPNGLKNEMEEFFDLMSSTNKEKADFLTPKRRLFFNRLADQAAIRGSLRLSFLQLDGKRLAACLVFDYRNTCMLYNSGYDPARSDLSVGLINKAFAIREAIELGRHRFDFLKGSERYKYGLGGQDKTIYRMVVTRS